MERFLVALRAAVYVTVFVLAWWWLAVHVQYFDRFLGFRFVAGVEWAGMVCLALGAAIAFSCVALFIVRGR